MRGGGFRELGQIAFMLWLETVGFAVYFFASRAYIRDYMGEEAYRYVALLVGVEGAATLIAPLGGVLGDIYGYRLVALLSALRVLVYPAMALVDPRLLFVPAFAGSLLGSIFYSNALGALLSRVRGSARTYAFTTIVFPISWSIGSVIPGLLQPLCGYALVFATAGLFFGLASIVLMFTSNSRSDASNYSEVFRALSSLSPALLLGLLLAGAGLTLYWNLLSVKLYEVTDSLLLFGLFGGTLATISSILVRPLAGIVVDKTDPVKLLGVVYIVYLVYGVLMHFISGIFFAILWILPVYPFREIAQTIAISRRLPENLQNTAGGVITLAYSLPSIVYPLFYIQGYGMREGLAIYVLTLSTASMIILMLASRRG